MPVQAPKRLFNVDEYYRMAVANILHEDDRVELLEGEIVAMSPIGSRHAACVDRLNTFFNEGVRGRAVIRVQSPIRLSDLSEPQPDLSLLRPKDDFYASGHPGPEDVILLIEVAETSVGYDRDVKLSLYARHEIPEVWIIDLAAETIVAHTDPEGESYRHVETKTKGRALSPQALPDLEWEVI